jgi:hypothetical protein
MKRKVAVLLIFIILLSILVVVVTYKPSIRGITLDELQEINGLGETLSTRVVVYLDTYPDADIDDLIDVRGIGEKKLDIIKKKWRD